MIIGGKNIRLETVLSVLFFLIVRGQRPAGAQALRLDSRLLVDSLLLVLAPCRSLAEALQGLFTVTVGLQGVPPPPSPRA